MAANGSCWSDASVESLVKILAAKFTITRLNPPHQNLEFRLKTRDNHGQAWYDANGLCVSAPLYGSWQFHKYLCSLRFWRCCLMRASILAATSSQSLVRVSFWGVVRPLSSWGVSEQEKDLRCPLCARHTVAYCTMLSSRGTHRGQQTDFTCVNPFMFSETLEKKAGTNTQKSWCNWP